MPAVYTIRPKYTMRFPPDPSFFRQPSSRPGNHDSGAESLELPRREE
jgi:hypothetical protein